MTSTARRLVCFVPSLGSLCLALSACASKPPPPPPAPMVETPPPVPPPTEPPPSSLSPHASYEEALAEPEAIDIHDGHAHLSDLQLAGPMRAVPGNCAIPRGAKVTVKVAVRTGRAIGVTVEVTFARPPHGPPPRPAQLKAEAKVAAKVVACLDPAVRALTWPPSARRDSFITQY